ncbi:MAG: TIGR01777 family protein [Deltaproteobacteria bacterium]|nr:TIGR01777 family protein [Deltaproteobacteria bacterium]MBK8238489.1 TIGR01777 family protein [Deltaproteobacteria bacterium]MBK8717317.1 TIGR01777 family protein [Deltaproteobacteria bacterium]MBP7286184.1 TIGR01777 family oxidoreductase [Nannocystaceae bacterium]
MRVAITGSSGLVGQAIVAKLHGRGDAVVPIRHGHGWDPLRGFDDPQALAGCDAVVHLAGESIAGRWTEARRTAIRDSRVLGTRHVVAAIAAADPSPRVLVCASAVGIFGDRGDEVLSDDAAPGTGFLAEVASAWEHEAAAATAHGTRVVSLRLGIVLAAHGGALERMRPLFRSGLGGRLGDGKQWMSWIHLDDAASAYVRALDDASMHGAYNLVAPDAVRNRDFTTALAQTLHRPAWLPAPAFMLELALGDMGRELLLASQRVQPDRLLAAGFKPRFASLQAALADVCAPQR